MSLNRTLIHLFLLSLALCHYSCNNTQITDQKPKISTEAVNWMSLEEAESATLKNPKPIFVMVHAKWCPHCKNFDKTTYQDPKVILDLNTNYYPVKLNAHANRTITYRSKKYTNPNYDASKAQDEVNSYHEVLYEIEAKSIPSIVFIDADFTVKGTELGFKPAGELRSLMAMYNN